MVHEYLGMTLNFSAPRSRKVKIIMVQYLKDMLDDLPKSLFNGIAATLAANHLFAIDHEAQPLEKTAASLFHTSTAKLLFFCKRVQTPRQPPQFLHCPDIDDLKKLCWVIQYFRV